jgi:hypothetical protein
MLNVISNRELSGGVVKTRQKEITFGSLSLLLSCLLDAYSLSLLGRLSSAGDPSVSSITCRNSEKRGGQTLSLKEEEERVFIPWCLEHNRESPNKKKEEDHSLREDHHHRTRQQNECSMLFFKTGA